MKPAKNVFNGLAESIAQFKRTITPTECIDVENLSTDFSLDDISEKLLAYMAAQKSPSFTPFTMNGVVMEFKFSGRVDVLKTAFYEPHLCIAFNPAPVFKTLFDAMYNEIKGFGFNINFWFWFGGYSNNSAYG